MKPTLLYISPFWPQKSGISEYSETLIWGLKEYYNIDILTKKKKILNQDIKDNFNIIEYSKNGNYSGYDYLIYNFGNSPDNHDYMYDMLAAYPGYVILHDFTLYYLTIDRYKKKDMLFQKIYEMEGVEGLITAKEIIKETGESDLIQHKQLPPLLPLNEEVLKNAVGVIVHSYYVRDKIIAKYPDKRVHKIEIVDCMPEIKLEDTDFLRKKYNLKPEDYIIGAVGMIAPSKLNHVACEAVNIYNKSHDSKIHYVMIGEGDYVDGYINKYIHKTGFLNNHDFFNAIKSCDVIFNLRNPYNGESSATLMQCMLMGKQCIVTDIGWFGELSDECVKKVAADITGEELSAFLEQFVAERKVNTAGIKFVKDECNSRIIAKSIGNFISSKDYK